MADLAAIEVNGLLAAVRQTIEERVAPSERALVRRFVERWLDGVPPEDLLGIDPLDLYGAALAHLAFGRKRTPGTALVRVYNPEVDRHGWQSGHTIVEIVNDDMPFLVDSATMEIARHGLDVHLTIHPVIPVRRDEQGILVAIPEDEKSAASFESFMHVEVDRLSDPDRLAALERDLLRVLEDVRAAVRDFAPMKALVARAAAECRPPATAVPPELLAEIRAFLDWLAADHFVFLGAASYRLVATEDGPELEREAKSALGILARRVDAGRSTSFAALPRALREAAMAPRNPLSITKANSRSTVHRPTWLDFIGVKRYDGEGRVVGEHRLFGLFTSSAYAASPREVPLLRRKVASVLARARLPKGGHAAKALAHILETYPRDELFQIDEDRLYDNALAILHLQERARVRLLVRPDPFGRFVSCLLFVPREQYNTALRERVQRLLERELGGGESEYQASVSESRLARILLTIRTPRGLPTELDPARLERLVAEAAQGWTEQLWAALLRECGEEEGNRLFRRYGQGFPASYRESRPARAAVPDIRAMDRLARGEIGPLAVRLYRRLEDRELVRFKLIRADGPLELSAVLPVLESLGLEVVSEEPAIVHDSDGRAFAVHDFGARAISRGDIDIDKVRDVFESAFLDAFTGRIEIDGFNRLILACGLSAREVTILRAYCRYWLQLGVPFSQSYIESVLLANADIARALVALFRARFEPGAGDRDERVARLEAELATALERVASLDEDRILRGFLELVRATLRTNWFQRDPADGRGKPYLSFKFEPARISGMPEPKPAFEIFVYAPWTEGVHLRGGKVARGGIRWSDRREDFRTEILALMKAQMVKNAIIVPVGAKGGFVVKKPPAGGDRQALQEEAIRCYRTFLRGLLDLTDNRVGDEVVPPPDVVRYDDDDPYLVVAADKGTATFSDIANEIAREYGFWLDDAFASGGSTGYDHKKLGITARGAWESLRRHFRELGLDPDRDPFTCVGIGDMSGDVFGNGMLLSDKIKLVAAFDHRHVFLDPDPDPAVSFAERRRLFLLPRSSWDDYDRAKISSGGGVWPRTAKSVPLSPQARRLLAVDAERLTPNELVQAILKAPVDVLWNGGIGTFVKAAAESHAEAADRSNDAVRVDAEALRCRVVIEGGNLGFTQRARIAFARRGGRINTDFIDNSAGVDCSDHEVNIKILLGSVIAEGELTRRRRDELLRAMSEEVAALVLRDNVLQNLALSVGQALAPELLDAHARLIRKLERAGRLDRALERLPDERELARRREAGEGLARPEAAVLLAHAKMALFDRLLASDLPDRAYFAADLSAYFPRPLRERFPEAIARHRLRREIVATRLANALVNRGLEVFVSQLEDLTGASAEEIALAFAVADDAFGLGSLRAELEELPASVPAAIQIELLAAVRRVLLDATRWVLANLPRPLVIRDTVAAYRPLVQSVAERLEEVLPADRLAALEREWTRLAAAGLEPRLVRRAAALPFLGLAAEAAAVALEPSVRGADETVAPLVAARVYAALETALGLGALRERLTGVPLRSGWDRMALAGLEDQLARDLRRLAGGALRAGLRPADPAAAEREVRLFLETEIRGLARWRALLAELLAAPVLEIAMLVVAQRALAELACPGDRTVRAS
ncbi:MAG: NAD-glutamate dehydrogenase [Geminicoccaceae bacterium]|nr:NAD-glutamate dehydrogenase [Geminicoccaceae bacterium]